MATLATTRTEAAARRAVAGAAREDVHTAFEAAVFATAKEKADPLPQQ